MIIIIITIIMMILMMQYHHGRDRDRERLNDRVIKVDVWKGGEIAVISSMAL
jgi:uncharacterized membrane protein